MPSFLYQERDNYKNFKLVSRNPSEPEEKRPNTAQKKKQEEETEKPIPPPRPPTAKIEAKTDVPEGYLKTYFEGISGPPTYVPKDSFFLDHSKPGKPVMKIRMENASSFVKGKPGE